MSDYANLYKKGGGPRVETDFPAQLPASKRDSAPKVPPKI